MSPEQYRLVTADLGSKRRLLSVFGVVFFFLILAALVCMF